jgi:hypothetical protein
MRNGIAYRLRPSAPLTAETGSGSWRIPGTEGTAEQEFPTPTAGFYGSSQNNPDGSHPRPSNGTPSLETMANRGKWRQPTTRAADEPELWPIPTSRDHKDVGDMSELPENALLARVVQRVERERHPTPLASDGRGGPAKDKEENPGRQGGPNLRTAIGGRLSPTWVEWLMGFPIGWSGSPPSGIPSSRRSPSGSAGESSSGKGAE